MMSAAMNRYRFFRKGGKMRIEGVSPLSEGAVGIYETLCGIEDRQVMSLWVMIRG